MKTKKNTPITTLFFATIIIFIFGCNNLRFGGKQIQTKWQKINKSTSLKEKEESIVVETQTKSLGGIFHPLDFKKNYKISFEIKSLNNSNDFCTIILPSNKNNYALYLGGLNDTIVGVGEVNNSPFSENHSTRIMTLQQDWQTIKINSYKDKITINIKNRVIELNLQKDTLKLPNKFNKYQPISILTNNSFELKNLIIKEY